MNNSEDKAIKTTFSNKKIVIASISIVMAILIAASIFFISFNNKSPEETKQSALESSPVYTEIVETVTVEDTPPASVIIAPATEAWWNSLKAFSPFPELNNISFDSLSENAIYISYTISEGKQFESSMMVGVPTTLITYLTAEDAEKARSSIPTDLFSSEVSGNTLLIIPIGAFSDVDYTISQVESKIKGEDPLKLNGEAYWQISLPRMEEIFITDAIEDRDKGVYKEFLTKVGITEEASWTGSSKDGLEWTGQFSGIDITKFVGADKLFEFLASQKAYIKTDGTVVYGESPSAEETSGVGFSKQAAVLSCCLVIATEDEISPPTFFIKEDSPFYSKLKKDSGIIKFVIEPNTMLATLIQVDSYPYSQIGAAEIVIKDNSGKATITLEHIDWYAPAEDGETPVEEPASE